MITGRVKLELQGKSSPPADMVAAAKKTLGDKYADYVAKFPGEITAQKLCKYLEMH